MMWWGIVLAYLGCVAVMIMGPNRPVQTAGCVTALIGLGLTFWAALH